jgi:hypothetical protein
MSHEIGGMEEHQSTVIEWKLPLSPNFSPIQLHLQLYCLSTPESPPTIDSQWYSVGGGSYQVPVHSFIEPVSLQLQEFNQYWAL